MKKILSMSANLLGKKMSAEGATPLVEKIRQTVFEIFPNHRIWIFIGVSWQQQKEHGREIC